MYIYVMYICIVLHYVFFLISCHLYSCFQAPRGFCNMRYINIYYYYYYYMNNFESPAPKDDSCHVWLKCMVAFSKRR